MSAHFIGVGPGAADLLTVRASRLIAGCGTCLFDSGTVPDEVLALCPPSARRVDTTGLSIDDVVAEIRSACERGDRVVRLYPGDPAPCPALSAQTRALDAAGIGWQVVPGVPVFAAAAAALGVDLAASQGPTTVFLTRVGVDGLVLPQLDGPAPAVSTDTTLVLHLPASRLTQAVRELLPIRGPGCPTGVVVSAGREGEATVVGTLGDIADRTIASDLARDVVMVAGSILDRGPRHGGRPGESDALDTRGATPTLVPTPHPSPTPPPASESASATASTAAAGPARATASARVPAATPGRILVLGGTGEARRLADLMATAGLDVVTSLAGKVARPRLPRGEVRIGGFGGAEGLIHWLRENDVSVVIDATDPYATEISAAAVRAAHETGVPLLRVHRPPWTPEHGDEWIRVPSMQDAARLVRDRFRRPMLTVGRQGPGAFAGDTRGSYLIRCAEPPPGPLPHRYLLVLDRGPFDVESERTILSRHRVDALVTRNSGGPSAGAKLRAARDLRIPVVMVDRPADPYPTGSGLGAVETVHSVDDAARWLVQRFGSR